MGIHFLFGTEAPNDPWQNENGTVTYQNMPPETDNLREVVIGLQKEKMVIWVGVAKENGSIIGLMAHIIAYKTVPIGKIDLRNGELSGSRVQSFFEEHGRWPRSERDLIKMAVNPMLVDEDERAFMGLIEELGEDVINLQNLSLAIEELPLILQSY